MEGIRTMLVLLPALISLLVVNGNEEQEYRTRFEYKYSFKGPNLVQVDQTVAFWNALGDIVPGDDQVRVVPSIRGKKGSIWSKYQFPYENWEIEVHIRIEGKGKIGADGMAIWYTDSTGEQGPVFGAKDFYRGVGIFLDSFDNDNHMNNPYISVVQNDGHASFSHSTDGINQQSGGCLKDFRNRPYPVKLKIRYYKKKLTVFYSPGNLADEQYEMCTEIENIDLPVNYHFGVSAATGGLADDHDVLKFLTWSLHDKAEQATDGIQEEERKKMQEDYEKNLEEFNKMHDEYKKDHPDAGKDDMYRDPAALLEGDASPELKSIFEIQSGVKKDIQRLSEAIQLVMQQQTSMSHTLNTISTGDGSQQPPAGADDNAKTYHIENLQNLQRETYDVVKQLRDTLTSLQHTITNLDVRVQQQLSANSQGGGAETYEVVQQRQSMIQTLHNLQGDVTALLQRQPHQPKLICPEPEMPSCVSLGVLIAIAIIQVIVLITYHSVKASQENAAKKFF